MIGNNITWGPSLAKEFTDLFESARVKPEHKKEVVSMVDRIVANRDRYEAVSASTTVPWYVIALIHAMEASLSFNTHLHNGDNLSRRTVNEPAGRPAVGSPPFTWAFSAADALHYDKLDSWADWSIAGILWKLESFNGIGYRKYHSTVLTPYLWSYTNHYESGKYVADGKWSSSAVSEQAGAAALLRELFDRGLLAPRVVPPTPLPVPAKQDSIGGVVVFHPFEVLGQLGPKLGDNFSTVESFLVW